MTVQNQSQEAPQHPPQDEPMGTGTGDSMLLEFDASDPAAEQQLGKIIKVIAIGGQGGNAGNNIYKKKLPYVEVIAFNTDQQDLNKLDIDRKYVIGKKITHYGGAGRKPENGAAAMKEDLDVLEAFLHSGEEADDPTKTRFAFVLAGLGGGTGSGAAPVAAECCKKEGYTTIAVVTMPTRYHGGAAVKIAKDSIAQLEQHVDKVLLIDNHKIYKKLSNCEKREAFNIIDAKVADAIESFVNIIRCVPRVNVDTNDIHTILTGDSSKIVIIGTGIGRFGEGYDPSKGLGEADAEEASSTRIVQAIEEAINSPILMYNSVRGANSILTYHLIHPDDQFTTGDDDTMITYLRGKSAMEDVAFLDGGGEDPSIQKGCLQLTVIATGYPEELTPSILFEKLLNKEGNELKMATVEMNDDEMILNDILAEVSPQKMGNKRPTGEKRGIIELPESVKTAPEKSRPASGRVIQPRQDAPARSGLQNAAASTAVRPTVVPVITAPHVDDLFNPQPVAADSVAQASVPAASDIPPAASNDTGDVDYSQSAFMRFFGQKN